MLKTSRLAILFVTVLVDMIGFGIVLPLLPFYAEEFGATPLQVTLLIASYSAMQFVAVPIWGRLSDRLGRRPFIVASLFASAVSYLIFGLAGSLTVLFLSRIAAGAAGGTISVAQAYVADTTGPEDRAHGLGMLGAASGLGILIGPAIGGYFSGFGYHVPGFIAAALCAVNGIAAVFLLPESRRPRAGAGDRGGGHGSPGGGGRPGRDQAREAQAGTLRGWVRAMTSYPFSLLLAVYFLSIMSFTAMTSVLALYADRAHGMDAMDMGVVFAVAGGTTVVVRGLLVGWLVRWWASAHRAGRHRCWPWRCWPSPGEEPRPDLRPRPVLGAGHGPHLPVAGQPGLAVDRLRVAGGNAGRAAGGGRDRSRPRGPSGPGRCSARWHREPVPRGAALAAAAVLLSLWLPSPAAHHRPPDGESALAAEDAV
jgi:MFS family permease